MTFKSSAAFCRLQCQRLNDYHLPWLVCVPAAADADASASSDGGVARADADATARVRGGGFAEAREWRR